MSSGNSKTQMGWPCHARGAFSSRTPRPPISIGGTMREIPLTQGKVALVDDEDYEWLNQWKWCLNSTGYAVRSGTDQGVSLVCMHRQIMGAQTGEQCDHVNHDKLDNRRSNLRVCLPRHNNYNKRAQSGASKYKGVSQMPNGRWVVQIGKNTKSNNPTRISFAGIKSEVFAARCYDTLARSLFGEFAWLNFPNLPNVRLPHKRIPSSRFRGVTFYKRSGRWKAQMRYHGKMVLQRECESEIGAALLYDEYARRYHGERAKVNFANDI